MSQERKMGDATRGFIREVFTEELLEELKKCARAVAGHKAGQVDASGMVDEVVLIAARRREGLRDPKAWARKVLVRHVVARLKLERFRRTQELGDEDLRGLRDRREQTDALERTEELSHLL